MIIKISECHGTNYTILSLLEGYRKIDKLVKDVLDNKIYCPYHDIAIKFNGQWHPIRYCGEKQSDEWFSKLKRLPSIVRTIPNDFMIIKSDEFERELFIDLDGDTQI